MLGWCVRSLENLGNLLLRFICKQASFRVTRANGLTWYKNARSYVFDRFDVDRGSVVEGDWGELSH